ncbi:MAG: VanZ family protein [Ignavibacteria bacterium]|jgi:VanZ family protein
MKFFKYHFLFIFWLAAIFTESSFPADVYPVVPIVNADKLVHIGIYGLLAALCYISIIHQNKFPALVKHALLITVLFSSLYGASDEFHQYFVPNRDCDFFDWLSDSAGAVIMVLIIKHYLSKKWNLFRKNNMDS